MNNVESYPEEQLAHFIEALDKLPDHRDHRGQRHRLAFIIASVVMALAGWAFDNFRYFSVY